MKICIRTTLGLTLLLGVGGIAVAQENPQFSVSGVSIGINVLAYPRLVPVPGYPVYYAPDLDNNFFFYDGLYWLYADDRWYESEWYDGPWGFVEPEAVPYYVLRIPVSYYRRPPPYFLEWDRRGPPRWGEHWGHDWEQRHHNWNQWNHGGRAPRAPLPEYQRNYPREHYPGPDQQQSLRDRDYHFRPREPQDRHSQENRPPDEPMSEARGHSVQSGSEQHRRALSPPERREPTSISQPPPRQVVTPPRGPNLPQPRRNDEPKPRHDMPGTQRPPQTQPRPQQAPPGAQPQPHSQPQQPRPQQPQPRQQPNNPRKDVPP